MDFFDEPCYSYGLDCNHMNVIIFTQSIDLSIHVTSDEKVQFFQGYLGTAFFHKLLVDIFVSPFPWAFCRRKCRFSLAYGMVSHDRVTCLQGNSTKKLLMICCSFSRTTQHFEWEIVLTLQFFGRTDCCF